LWGEPGQVSLFNLKEDIGETTDLARDMPELASEMRKKLHEWRKSVNAQEMQRNPFYNPENAYHRSETGLSYTRGPGIRHLMD
jgi:hypothetical protein